MSPRDALLRYPLFAALGAPFVEVWAGMGEPLTVQTGQTLFQAGSRGDQAYLVRSGRVRVLKLKEEREVSLGAFAAGDVFGDYALLTPYKNTATCRACEPGQLLRLPLAPVRAALGRMPEISVKANTGK
jgi:CRP/FNR family transcriptional regulator